MLSDLLIEGLKHSNNIPHAMKAEFSYLPVKSNWIEIYDFRNII